MLTILSLAFINTSRITDLLVLYNTGCKNKIDIDLLIKKYLFYDNLSTILKYGTDIGCTVHLPLRIYSVGKYGGFQEDSNDD